MKAPRVLGALVVCACSGPPAAAPSAEGRVEPLVLDLKPAVDVRAAPEPSAPAAMGDADTCLSARFDGPVGNCIEPSLFVVDSCGGRVFTFGFNDCVAARYDERSLAINGPHLIGASVHDSLRQRSLGEVTAVRGRVTWQDRGIQGPMSFDLEVDVVDGVRQTTTHLVGAVP